LSRDHAETTHALTLQNVADSKEPILADFDQDETIRSLMFPGEDEPRLVTPDDIAYTIGTGKYVQRYVYKTTDNQLLVLPIEWNTQDEQWQPFSDGEEQWPDFVQNCADCHTVGLEVETGEWVDDGVQCEACHGAGGAHVEIANNVPRRASDEDLIALRANIVLSPDPQICGQCHNRGVSEDGHSFPVEYEVNTELLDTYTLYPPDDSEHWWSSEHAKQPNMQFNEWYHSAHASALETLRSSTLAEDTCLQCHSVDYRWTEQRLALFEEGILDGPPPDPVTVETAQYGVTCSSCHNPHREAEAELPAYLVEEPYTLCVSCHVSAPQEQIQPHHPVQEMFEGVEFVDGVEGITSTHHAAEGGPDCLTCHMVSLSTDNGIRNSHMLTPVLPTEAETGQPDSCSGCHENLAVVDLQFLIDDTQDAVRERLTTAWARLASVDPAILPDEYEQVSRALTFVQNDGSLGVHNYDYANALLEYSERTLAKLSVPGASINPTEAPAPTEIPEVDWRTVAVSSEPETEEEGFRPITMIILGFTGVIVFGSAIVIFRWPKRKVKETSDNE
jgi:predicted CXXCH cytochrome family protein